jgi:branched-chain amino acid transport system permease protein
MDNLIASVALFTNPTVIARQIMAGLANGVLLFLVASGLSLIFGLSRIINFAHGALFMLGAYFAYSVVGAAQTDLFTFFLMLLASTVGLFIFGVAFEMAVLRRIYRSAQAFQLLVTFGLVLILSDAVRLIAGPAEKSVQLPVALEGFVRPFGVTFPVYRVALIAIGLSIGIGLWVLLYRTRWGTLVRAATADRETLSALGTDTRKIFTMVFGLGAALAGLAGGLATPLVSVGPGLHAEVLTDAFVIVAIGGMGSFAGALIGALLVGQANAFGVLMFPQMAIVVPFALMALILVLRPRGLMGRIE